MLELLTVEKEVDEVVLTSDCFPLDTDGCFPEDCGPANPCGPYCYPY